ncbi:MAG TPA: enoyl-CoA hydratase [Myxococcales bacterium]|jgi:enoyl-CoA hydratase/carnithine racemase|nr:enoyl-CoA hydratase [Myxococcales bacterium]
MAATPRNLLIDREGRIVRITLNRPERRNALSLELLQELLRSLEGIGQDREAGVVIVRANGPAFSAGHDIAEMIDRDAAFYQQLFGVCTQVMETIQSIPQPVIAEVHGMATAAGCQLVASCDLVVAAAEARFATPGVKIGLFCSTPMVALTRAIGAKKAMEMLLTGEPISAAEALAAGLVNRVVPAAELAAATRALAERILSFSPYVVGLGKKAFYRQIRAPQSEAYAQTGEVMCTNAAARDAQEGMRAFVEKRAPRWGGH